MEFTWKIQRCAVLRPINNFDYFNPVDNYYNFNNYITKIQMEQNNRTWDLLKASKRTQISLNPIRNWVESVVPETEKNADPNRPNDKLVFLLGDPTCYKLFKTPEAYKDIAINSVGKIDGYTDFLGDSAVRTELAQTLSTEKWPLTKDDVILTAAGSAALFYATIALAGAGDRILMPRPTFPLVKAFADFLGVEVVFYDLSPGTWQPNIIELEAIWEKYDRIKFILVNSPSNPMGSVLTDESLQEIVAFCERHGNLPIVSDEIYEEMVFKPNKFRFLNDFSTSVPILRCSGLTKRCLVPGWRMGWIVFFGRGDSLAEVKRAVRQMANILLMPHTVCQAALNEVYKLSSEIIPQKMDDLEKRYKALHHGLHDAYGVSVGETKGAMYATVLINPEEFEDIGNSKEFAIKLQQEENTLVFPGELFYGSNFVRMVICGDLEQFEEACLRIKRFTLRHKKGGHKAE